MGSTTPSSAKMTRRKGKSHEGTKQEVVGSRDEGCRTGCVRLPNRAEPNLLRTLGKLEAFGFLEMRTVDRRRVPTPMIKMLHFAIDPYSMADRIEISPAP